jgi:hypothetical protein
MLLGSVVTFTSAIESYRNAAQPLAGLIGARLLAYVVFPLFLSLLGIITSCGLFGLREWARRAAVSLATVPVLGCGLLILVRPRSVFPEDIPSGPVYAPFIGIGLAIYEVLFCILVPFSLWFLIFFTRKSVKAQFR